MMAIGDCYSGKLTMIILSWHGCVSTHQPYALLQFEWSFQPKCIEVIRNNTFFKRSRPGQLSDVDKIANLETHVF